MKYEAFSMPKKESFMVAINPNVALGGLIVGILKLVLG